MDNLNSYLHKVGHLNENGGLDVVSLRFCDVCGEPVLVCTHTPESRLVLCRNHGTKEMEEKA